MPSPHHPHPPRHLVLEYVSRRDASHRLSIAFALLTRTLQEQDRAAPDGAEVDNSPSVRQRTVLEVSP